jgi:hypothetical protein
LLVLTFVGLTIDEVTGLDTTGVTVGFTTGVVTLVGVTTGFIAGFGNVKVGLATTGGFTTEVTGFGATTGFVKVGLLGAVANVLLGA